MYSETTVNGIYSLLLKKNYVICTLSETTVNGIYSLLLKKNYLICTSHIIPISKTGLFLFK